MMSVFHWNLDQIKDLIIQIWIQIWSHIAHTASSTQYTSHTNDSGDQVNTLDEFAHRSCIRYLSQCPLVCSYASEEDASIVPCHTYGSYHVAFDPLDGSKNASVNRPVWSIFAIFATWSQWSTDLADYCADDIVMSAYILYGSQTTVVVADVSWVTHYVLDLEGWNNSEQSLLLPDTCDTLATNMLNIASTLSTFRNFIDIAWFRKFAYSRCMVSDVALIVAEWWMFAYPSNTKNPHGKLRLLYECWPMAWIISRLGGRAIDDRGHDVLSLHLNSLHQTSSILIGSMSCIDQYLQLISSDTSF